MSDAALDPRWPELLAGVAETLGEGVALQLARSFGGRQVYIPLAESIDEAHPLASALGLGPARRLAELLGAGKIIIPLGPTSRVRRTKAEIRRLRGEGLTQAETARRLGVHVKTVEYRERRDRAGEAKPRLPDLFD